MTDLKPFIDALKAAFNNDKGFLDSNYTDIEDDDASSVVLDGQWDFAAIARALADAGLLAPAPLTEEWHAAYYGVTRDGVRHLRLIGTEGSREHAEETRADCAQDDPDTAFFLVRRPAHDWLPVDDAEDDGRCQQ